MKRILYIATSNVFFDTGGGIANRAFMNSLLEAYPGKVDVIHMQTNKGGAIPSYFHLVPGFTTISKLFALFSGRIHRYNPWVMNYLDSHPNEYSHCILNCGILGDIVPEIKNRGIKVAVIHHNYEVEFQMDNRNPSTFWGTCPILVRRNEKKAYKNADLNLFLTSSDKETLAREYGSTHSSHDDVVGIFEAEEHKDSELENKRPLIANKLVICGSLNSVQTLKGLKDFANHYLEPLHKYYHDDFLLTLTGRSPGEYIQKLASNDLNISLIPSPQNILEVVKESGIFICPTNVGGGIKLRIMDGLKLGLPILTHKISARGYDCFYDKPWFRIYQDKGSFLEGLESLNKIIKDQATLRTIIKNEYKEYYSYTTGKKRFLKSIDLFLSD